jgi:valyl-tRNA synthetase
MRTEVASLTVRAPQTALDLLAQAMDDVRAAGKVMGAVVLEPDAGSALGAEVVLTIG